jgi:hypothetical protein
LCGGCAGARRLPAALCGLSDNGDRFVDAGRARDKGSINQRAVLEHREALVEALYSLDAGADVITP